MSVAFLSLGSNKGDRLSVIQQAVNFLSADNSIEIAAASSFYETEPWQMHSENWFVNAVIQISTTLQPEELLKECKNIEIMLGRKRDEGANTYSDRTIDIDIIFYDNLILNSPNLTIPHRFFHRRVFMLVPMLEIAQDFVHPLFNKTVEKLYDEIENPEMVCLYGTRL